MCKNLFVVAFPAMLLIFWFGNDIIPLLYASSFLEIIYLLKWELLGKFLKLLSFTFSYDCQKTNNSLCFVRVDFWSFVFGIEYVVYRSLRSCWCINCLCRNLFLVFVVGGDLLRKAF